jgi:putative endonuclease
MSKSRYNKGQAGENTAVEFLVGNGMEIVERNFRCPPGEIDIVAKDGRVLVFVEVRTRQSKGFGTPEESITALKRTRLIRAAQWYLKKHNLYNSSARFDVVTIRWNGENIKDLNNPENLNNLGSPQINWIVNAFEAYS